MAMNFGAIAALVTPGIAPDNGTPTKGLRSPTDAVVNEISTLRDSQTAFRTMCDSLMNTIVHDEKNSSRIIQGLQTDVKNSSRVIQGLQTNVQALLATCARQSVQLMEQSVQLGKLETRLADVEALGPYGSAVRAHMGG